MHIEQESLNRSTWSTSSSRRWLDSIGPFTDQGERVAFDLVKDLVRDRPILDLGVGTGRTIPLFRALTDDYLGIDYLPSMVETCRTRHPSAHVELGDARDLAGVPSRQFALVCFSFNGIDAVDHVGRQRALAEMRRVVRDDGVVLFSTLNMDGPAFRERPWSLRLARTRNPALLALRTAHWLSTMPLDALRWSRLRAQSVTGPGWAVAPLSAHHYGVLAHFTTLEHQLAELEEAGLDRHVIAIENERGERVSPDDDTSQSAWFHIVARPR